MQPTSSRSCATPLKNGPVPRSCIDCNQTVAAIPGHWQPLWNLTSVGVLTRDGARPDATKPGRLAIRRRMAGDSLRNDLGHGLTPTLFSNGGSGLADGDDPRQVRRPANDTLNPFPADRTS